MFWSLDELFEHFPYLQDAKSFLETRLHELHLGNDVVKIPVALLRWSHDSIKSMLFTQLQ